MPTVRFGLIGGEQGRASSTNDWYTCDLFGPRTLLTRGLLQADFRMVTAQGGAFALIFEASVVKAIDDAIADGERYAFCCARRKRCFALAIQTCLMS